MCLETRLISSVVKAMFQFVQIGVQMLDAQFMIRPDHRTLKQAPNALYAVGVNIRVYPLFFTVHTSRKRDGLVPEAE